MTGDADATRKGIVDFFDDYAAALADGDIDGAAGCFALPLMVVRSGATTFIEDEAALEASVRTLLDDWRTHGVVRGVPTIASIQPLPDDAARVVVDWSRDDADGNPVLRFALTYTLTEEDGDWSIVLMDTTDEARARGEAGWA